MAEIRRATLFGKLNPLAYKAIESATVFCKMRGNPNVETAHWLHQLLQSQETDVQRILKHFQIDASRLAADLIATLDKLPRGATSISDFSPDIPAVVERAWVYGSLMFGELQVRTGHLVVGFLNSELRHKFLAVSREFNKIKLEELTDSFGKITAGSPEDALRASDGSGMSAGASPGESSGAMAPAAMGKQEALAKFSVDLTEKARKGEIDPIVGRDEEIRQVVDILMRRRQNNPILTGEAGVGKTAVVEGFAARIARGDVPPPLKNVQVYTLDIGLLQAGASMKGEFENRLRQVIDEVQASAEPIILFVDEAHTLIGAGGAAGTGDAANLLKPALARGTLRTVAATTWAEYKKYIEKDPALTRRFQVVQVAEPSEDKALLMVRGVASTLEKHHRVQLLDEALEAAVRLSHRYIPARQLPDKAVSLLDTVCARVAISQHAVPPQLEDCRKTIEALQIELAIIGREEAVGVNVVERRRACEEKLAVQEKRREELEKRWEEEHKLADRLLEIRAQLRKAADQSASAKNAPQTGANKADAESIKSAPTPSPADAAVAKGETAATKSEASATASLTPEARAQLLAELADLQSKLSPFLGEPPLFL